MLDFAVAIMRICGRLSKTIFGRHIALQLFRASTSSGANYEEARGAESRADFVHKLQVVLKELRESLYWLRLISRAGLLPAADVAPLLDEANELTKILGKSVVTSKGLR